MATVATARGTPGITPTWGTEVVTGTGTGTTGTVARSGTETASPHQLPPCVGAAGRARRAAGVLGGGGVHGAARIGVPDHGVRRGLVRVRLPHPGRRRLAFASQLGEALHQAREDRVGYAERTRERAGCAAKAGFPARRTVRTVPRPAALAVAPGLRLGPKPWGT